MADPPPSFFSRPAAVADLALSFAHAVLGGYRAKTMIQEYLRRIIEACLVSAREGGAGGGGQLGGKAAAGVVPEAAGAKGATAGWLRTSQTFCKNAFSKKGVGCRARVDDNCSISILDFLFSFAARQC